MIAKADKAAADRLLKAAVRRAIEIFREGGGHERARSTLLVALTAASLLIDEKP